MLFTNEFKCIKKMYRRTSYTLDKKRVDPTQKENKKDKCRKIDRYRQQQHRKEMKKKGECYREREREIRALVAISQFHNEAIVIGQLID
jgi:hypothetical protein